MSPDIKRQALGFAERAGLVNQLGRHIASRFPKIVRVDPFTPEFQTAFRGLTDDGGVPLLVFGHFNHMDPIVGAHLCKGLVDLSKEGDPKKQLNGFVATLAKSVKEGKQSPLLKGLYPTMEAYANLRSVEFVEITREVDVRRYGMKKDRAEIDLLKARVKREGVGVVILAGGTVQPGRHPEGKKGDDIFGLKKLEDGDTDITSMFAVMGRWGRDLNQYPYFVPVGINRTYRFLSSDSLMMTPEGIASIYDRPWKILSLLGIERMFVDIKVGMPLMAEDMAGSLGTDWRNNPNEINNLLMRRVALLLPPNARGEFSNLTSSGS
ncbi:hypothetical protein HYW44_01965 [Candidatus Daviesbacteria bacterium]|nr:hypothetical protein [Candidatus Daviesbacteria bacterium]